MKSNQKTYLAKPGEVKSNCYILDAKDKILGRVATKAAIILRGKHKPQYTPNVDTGDMVVIINADKIKVSGNKAEDKMYQKYTGFHSGRKVISFGKLHNRRPEAVLRLAVNRMIPRNPLGYKVRTKLRVYSGDKHPHIAQKPIALEF